MGFFNFLAEAVEGDLEVIDRAWQKRKSFYDDDVVSSVFRFVFLPFVMPWRKLAYYALIIFLTNCLFIFIVTSVFDFFAGSPKSQGGFLGWLRDMLCIVTILFMTFVSVVRAMAIELANEYLTDSHDTTHGSARLSTWSDARDKGHLQKYKDPPIEGMMLGYMIDELSEEYEPLFYQEGHILTCAPTGAGKGVSAIIPNLLMYEGSMVVLDIKGENYAVTGKARREMGHEVHVIDPYRITGIEQSASFNWMDKINVNDEDCLSQSELLADCIVMTNKNARNPHFDESARTLIQGVILYVAGTKPPEEKNLGSVRYLLSRNHEDFIYLMDDMSKNDDLAYGVPASIANTILSIANEELGSIRSTINRHMSFLDDPRVKSTLSSTTVQFQDLKRKKMTVYIVIPQHEIKRNVRLTRTIVASSLGGITTDSHQPDQKVVFLLDEFAQLGSVQAISDSISIVRGYGAAIWLIVQDLAQLKAAYPDCWETFIANTTKHFFAVSSYESAKYFSDMMGKTTIKYTTEGAGSNRQDDDWSGKTASSSDSTSEHITQRSLMTPDELLSADRDDCFVLARGERPYKLVSVPYYKNEVFAERAQPNPYYATVEPEVPKEQEMKNVTPNKIKDKITKRLRDRRKAV